MIGNLRPDAIVEDLLPVPGEASITHQPSAAGHGHPQRVPWPPTSLGHSEPGVLVRPDQIALQQLAC